MSIATVDQLAARVPGGIAAADEDRAQAVLDDVSTLINAEAEGAWDSDTPPDVVVTICLAASRRAWVNPDGKVSETIGGYSYRVPDATATGVFLTDDEKRMIRKAAGVAEAGVATVTLNPDFTGTDYIYLDVEGSERGLPGYPTSWVDGT